MIDVFRLPADISELPAAPYSFGENEVILRAATVFNVRAFGAMGNGTDDDTSHVQSAIDSAQDVNGRVYIPAGTYLVDALRVTSPIVIEGEAALEGFFNDIQPGQAGFAGTVLKAKVSGHNIIELVGPRFPHMVIRGLRFRGLGVLDSGHGNAIWVDPDALEEDSRYFTIEDCVFEEVSGWCFLSESTTAIFYNARWKSLQCSRVANGFKFAGGSPVFAFDTCYICGLLQGGTGFDIKGSPTWINCQITDTLDASGYCHMGAHAPAYTGTTIHYKIHHAALFIGCHWEQWHGTAIKMTPGSGPLTLIGGDVGQYPGTDGLDNANIWVEFDGQGDTHSVTIQDVAMPTAGGFAHGTPFSTAAGASVAPEILVLGKAQDGQAATYYDVLHAVFKPVKFLKWAAMPYVSLGAMYGPPPAQHGTMALSGGLWLYDRDGVSTNSLGMQVIGSVLYAVADGGLTEIAFKELTIGGINSSNSPTWTIYPDGTSSGLSVDSAASATTAAGLSDGTHSLNWTSGTLGNGTWSIAADGRVTGMSGVGGGSIDLNNLGGMRVTNINTPTTGAGLEFYFTAGIGAMYSYDRTPITGGWRDAQFGAANFYFTAAGGSLYFQGGAIFDSDITGTAFHGVADSALGLVDSSLTPITPVADGTYTVGIGPTTNGTITTVGGLITAVQEAS